MQSRRRHRSSRGHETATRVSRGAKGNPVSATSRHETDIRNIDLDVLTADELRHQVSYHFVNRPHVLQRRWVADPPLCMAAAPRGTSEHAKTGFGVRRVAHAVHGTNPGTGEGRAQSFAGKCCGSGTLDMRALTTRGLGGTVGTGGCDS